MHRLVNSDYVDGNHVVTSMCSQYIHISCIYAKRTQYIQVFEDIRIGEATRAERE